MEQPAVGSITWFDLTVDDAEGVRDFYEQVVGWKHEAVPMGDYSDFTMSDERGTGIAGICHARGTNAGTPPQWMIYITVADVEESAQRCREGGGEVLVGPKNVGDMGRYCVIKDPAGAVAALFQPAGP